jgi:hypothetical protein
VSTAPPTSRSLDAWITPVLISATLLGWALRVVACFVLGPHIDEAESVLAARIVAEHGVPMLPSGVLFLQGFTLSYILPLFDWVGDPYDFTSLRLVSALAGTACIPAAYGLARAFGASRAVGLLAAVALACDGLSIEWSAHVRPYAMLQLETTLLLTVWLRALERRSLGLNGVVSALFAISVFTHLGVVLLLPAMALITGIRHRGALLRERRDLLVTGVSLVVPVLVFVCINTAFGVTTSGAEATGPSFIGDHLMALRSILKPDIHPWEALFQRSATHDIPPYMIVFAAGILLMSRSWDVRTFALLVCYALPIAIVAVFTTEAHARYLLHVHPMSWIIIGLGFEELLALGGPHRVGWRVFTGVAALAAVSHIVDGAYARLVVTNIDRSYPRALKWLEGQHVAGEPVLSSMTSVTYFSSIPQSDFLFLAGPQGADRTVRYSRVLPDGRTIDYWSGVPAITSTHELCALLQTNPKAWLVVDDERLSGGWAYRGAMQDVILGGTVVMHEEPETPSVYRVRPAGEWTPKATEACLAIIEPPQPAIPVEPAE